MNTEDILLTDAELPAYCPNKKMTTWNSHPRVFLDMTEGKASCPYCGTRYRLASSADESQMLTNQRNTEPAVK